jgi:hypothetical protein
MKATKPATSMGHKQRPPRRCPQGENIQMLLPSIQKPRFEFSLGGPPRAFKKRHDSTSNKENDTWRVSILPGRDFACRLKNPTMPAPAGVEKDELTKTTPPVKIVFLSQH